MKIVIFGATGTVGRHVVEQALEQGHQVTAFTRGTGSVRQRHPRLDVVQGDVTDPAAVRQAVIGQDAVLVTLGAGRKGGVRSEGTRVIVRVMEDVGVRRLICQSTLGVGDSRSNLDFVWKRIMFGLLLRPAYRDHVEQEEHVRRSHLDWTIVRPAAFTDGPRTGEYRHGFGPGARSELKISRADVADFMLGQVAGGEYLRDTPALSY